MSNIDEKLRQYATETQWSHYLLFCEHGSFAEASRASGIDRANLARDVRIIKKRAAQQGYMPPKLDLNIPEGMTSRGPSVLLDANGDVLQVWNKMKPQGRDPADAVQLKDPKRIKRVATLTDNQGNVSQQWVTEEPGAEEKEALWRILADELKAELPRYTPIMRAPGSKSDLLACYPIGDHHLGMLAWKHETKSDSYDMEISEKLLMDAMTHLVRAVPPCQNALVAGLGDFLHYDSFDSVTPTSRNLLDADGRFPKMVRLGIRTFRFVIDEALRHHDHVTVIVEIGNHDLSSMVWLMELLAAVYENDPRVTVVASPTHYHYFEFGKVLIGTHHGHGTKLERLPQIMAADMPEAWGRTRHRYWWTGHIHNRTAIDYAGCSVESFRILAPVDAWAAQKGYRPIRDMKAMVMDREHGEIARYTVNPRMFK